MPIEFRCTQCQKLLRVPDETAGRQAKCPACDTVLTIPNATTSVRGDAPLSSSSGTSPFNPYQSPAAVAHAPEPMFQPGDRVFRPTTIDPTEVITRSWEIFQLKMGLIIGVVLLWLLVAYGTYYLIYFVALAISLVQEAIGVILMLVGMPAWGVLFLWTTLGAFQTLLRIARGENTSIGDIFRGGPYLARTIGASVILFFLIIAVTMLPIVPGIVLDALGAADNLVAIATIIGAIVAFVLYMTVALMFGQYMFLILDRDAGVVESLTLSRQITATNRLRVLLILFVASFVAPAGCLACGVGAAFTYPFATLMVVVTYLSMTGQPTIESFARQVDEAPPA